MKVFHSGTLEFPVQWRIRQLLLWQFATFALMAAWFLLPLERWIAPLDEAFYLVLNGTLAGNEGWQTVVAFANTKLYDKLSTLFLIFLLLAFAALGWGKDEMNDAGRRLAAGMFVGLFMLVTVNIRKETAFLEYGRYSPSLVLDSFINVRESNPDLRPKVTSHDSFPGDHGISCMIFVTLFWYYAGWRAGLLALVLTPLFTFPRWIGGAHWFSDMTIDSTIFAMLVLSWAVYSPLGGYCCRGLHWLIKKCLRIVPAPLRRGVHAG